MVLLHQNVIGIHLIMCVRVMFAICQANWDKYGDYCYIVLSDSSSFTNTAAKQACEVLSSRANLIMPKTELENDYIETKVDQSTTLWLGLTDLDLDGTFFWDDGTKLNTTDFDEWDDWQPDNNDPQDKDEKCVIAQDGDWNDKPCTMNAGVMCQMSQEPEVESTSQSVEPTTESTLTTPEKSSSGMGSTLFRPETVTTAKYSTSMSYTDALLSTESSNTDIPERSNQYTPFSTESISVDPTSTVGSNSMVSPGDWETSTHNALSIQNCTCQCSFQNKGIPTQISLEDILKDIRVKKELLSSETRKRQSASDSRMSSFCIGCTAASVLVCCILSIICLDCAPKRNTSFAF